MLEKLNALGLAANKLDLEMASRISASSFCRRRLPVIMVKRKLIIAMVPLETFMGQNHGRGGGKFDIQAIFLNQYKILLKFFSHLPIKIGI